MMGPTDKQKRLADDIEAQGYTRKQAERKARELAPTRQQAAAAKARAGKTKKDK